MKRDFFTALYLATQVPNFLSLVCQTDTMPQVQYALRFSIIPN